VVLLLFGKCLASNKKLGFIVESPELIEAMPIPEFQGLRISQLSVGTCII
jgi:hypothetical protein